MVKRKEKGVTLLEVVVAMALIATLSASIFVTINFANKSRANNRVKHFFINETENVLMCYYSDDFESSLTFLTNNEITIPDDSDCFFLYYTEDFNYTDEENAVYTLEIEYTNKFSPVVTCLSSRGIIYNFGGTNDE